MHPGSQAQLCTFHPHLPLTASWWIPNIVISLLYMRKQRLTGVMAPAQGHQLVAKGQIRVFPFHIAVEVQVWRFKILVQILSLEHPH